MPTLEYHVILEIDIPEIFAQIGSLAVVLVKIGQYF